MEIATWNVNSVRARQERLLRWLATHRPEILCLQELKATEAQFPLDAVRSLGYEAALVGQKTYNGVAILSRVGLDDVRRGLDDGVDDATARFVSATVAGVRVLSVYVPNGQVVGSDKWTFKLEWLGRLRRHLERHHRPSERLALCGDFNVAPEERDVQFPGAWERSVLFHPEARRALAEVVSWGLTDTLRLHHQGQGPYTWWDYRMLSFPKNDGLRLDHVFATEPLARTCTAVDVHRDERKGKQPSDHVPVVARFA